MNITICFAKLLILCIIQETKALDKKIDIEKVTSLNHSLNNAVCIIESSMNLLRNADINTLGKRWRTAREALLVTGRDRINKEIDSFSTVSKTVERVSKKIYTDTNSQFLETDKYYKSLFDLIINSKEYSDEAKSTSFAYGNKIVYLINNIINNMEIISVGLQKI